MSKLTPLRGYVLLEPIAEQTKTKSGFEIPEEARDTKWAKGKIVAIGDYPIDLRKEKNQHTDGKGNILQFDCLVGIKLNDTVWYRKFSTTPAETIREEGKEYIVVHYSDILVKYEND